MLVLLVVVEEVIGVVGALPGTSCNGCYPSCEDSHDGHHPSHKAHHTIDIFVREASHHTKSNLIYYATSARLTKISVTCACHTNFFIQSVSKTHDHFYFFINTFYFILLLFQIDGEN